MSSFTQGLKDRIEALRDEREELEDSMSRIDAKIETLEELLAEEEEEVALPSDRPKRKRGRPKGSKKKTAKKASEEDQALYDEACATLPEAGTTPEQQEKLANRFRPTPRVTDGLGPGIRAGTKKDIQSKTTKSDKTITVEDE